MRSWHSTGLIHSFKFLGYATLWCVMSCTAGNANLSPRLPDGNAIGGTDTAITFAGGGAAGFSQIGYSGGTGGTQGQGGAISSPPDGRSNLPTDTAVLPIPPGDAADVPANLPDSAKPDSRHPVNPTVIILVIDGLMADTANTAAQNGATNLKYVLENGVQVATVRSTCPAIRVELPGGIRPWGNATSGNVAMHTGTHLFEADSSGMDDIFLATKAVGIKSVYSGGDNNYGIFKSATFNYGKRMEDQEVVDHAIKHLRNDGARLFRLHLQRVRDVWKGPADKTNPNSAYLQKIVEADGYLGKLIAACKEVGVWDSTYLIIAGDHGMAGGSSGPHPANVPASWEPFLGFGGPGLKKGASIPYAELPDIAVTTMHFFGLPPLKGHTAASPNLSVVGPTGTVLLNLFEGANAEMNHPRYIDQYLKQGKYTSLGDSYTAYRTFMLDVLR